ncbi:MAG: hypothetical protein JST75_14755 [Bacteroidetes bacterium]|nr:hypothetical protein [Bacteroidota bacterium]
MKKILITGKFLLVAIVTFAQIKSAESLSKPGSLCNHKILLDDSNKIISWMGEPQKSYEWFLKTRWNFIKTKVPMSPGPSPRSLYPQYYFYCAFKNNMEPDTWMNDVGEKIPNWFESARLYYAFTGDTTVMNIVRSLIDYTIDHGTTPFSFAWPNFPYTTTNAGDTVFRGFTSAKRFVLHEVQVDHAGDMGLTYYRLFLYTGDIKYRDAAIRVANTLASKVRKGDKDRSPWPYRVTMDNGKVTAEYCANWIGAYTLLDNLAKANLGNVKSYEYACTLVRRFLLDFPLRTGYWTDGHTDTYLNSNTYKSNMSASNFTLYLLDHPEFDPHWQSDVPALIKWTEDNFVFHCAPNEPSNQWGANIVGEQDSFLYKMDYQTARYGASCAKWYSISGNASYKEKAYRSLNWVTYCNDSSGKAFESPLSKGVLSWWSDCYGEGPRMFYHALAAVPDWAPHRANHILYSTGILNKVEYKENSISYHTTEREGIEYIRASFRPKKIMLGKMKLNNVISSMAQGYSINDLGNGDFSIRIKRNGKGVVMIE